ncbi:phage portal protein [Telmatospirillum sp. J64-1]|uniref:phage portal protein n=1 Tax=Telmatospirillum sp. J64-1 TaxID=2502183 RepID=UPI00115EBE49|nr:phage portal protein [Telmatospirillum sp. J64-1]
MGSLVDQWGGPMKASAQTTAYAAADRFSQELSSWSPSLRGPDSEWLPERDTVTARVHDIARNNGWASGALQRYIDQAIGAEFRLLYRPDAAALGVSPEWARDFAREVEHRFRLWAEDPRFPVDAGRRLTLSALLGLLFRHRLADGEALAVAHWLPRPDSSYATAIQVIDPDRLSTPAGMIDGPVLRGGIEMDGFGAPLAFHIRGAHPGDAYAGAEEVMRWQRIPRSTPWGRMRVLHFFEPERAGQTRGKSLLAPVLEKLKMEDRYGRIELQAALVNAIFAAFIESPFDQGLMEDLLAKEGRPNPTAADHLNVYQRERGHFHKKRNPTLDGVQIHSLFPGEKFNFAAATRPNQAFAEFERSVLRYIAAGIGQSYEQLAQDWSQTNYSSARAALLESWKFLVARRQHFAAAVARPIFALWLEEEFDRGEIDLPRNAPGFWEAFPAWTRCRWIGPGRGWVDPVKEADAAGKRMDYQLSTQMDECAEQGRDFEEVLEQQSYERALRASYGLPEPTSPGVTEDMGNTDPDEEDEEGAPTRQGRDVGSRLTNYETRMADLQRRALARPRSM